MLKPAFQAACRAAVEALARETADGGPAVLIGTPWVEDGKLYNAYALLAGGRIEAIRFKVDLPNYGVFDEKRVFAAGPLPGPVELPRRAHRRADLRGHLDPLGRLENVVECLAETGGEILLCRTARPTGATRSDVRLNVCGRARHRGRPAAHLRQPSRRPGRARFRRRVVCAQRRPLDRIPASRLPRNGGDDALVASGGHWRCTQGPIAAAEEPEKSDYIACMVGLRDYVDKNRFKGVVLGLSGGIDSALCAAMATDALGAARVRCVMLPFRFTAQDSLDDAAAIASALGVRYDIVPIESAVRGLEAALDGRFCRRAARRHRRKSAGARPRHHSHGDFQQIRLDGGDDRQQVGNVGRLRHALRRHERRLQSDQGPLQDRSFSPGAAAQSLEAGRRARPDGPVIPENVLTRAPSAELRENQTDQDTLPPYDVLDQILERLVEREQPTADASSRPGFDRDTVMKVERMLYLAEYKRRQAAPGVKVTLKNFGRDRRYPIVNRFHDPGTPPPEPDRTLVAGAAMAKAGAADF